MVENKKNNYLLCNLENNHKGEILSKICLKKDCDLKLICDICLNSLHKKHNFESIKVVKNECMKFVQNFHEIKFLKFLTKIEENKAESLKNFDKFFED